MNEPNALLNISSGLISAWRLEELGGSDASDTVNANDLSESNAINIHSAPFGGNIGSGRHFKGNAFNQGLEINDGNQGGLGGEDFNAAQGLSILAWVKHDTISSDQVLVVKGTNTTDDEYDLHFDSSNNAWEFRVTDGGGSQTLVRSTAFSPVSINTPYMVYAEWHKADQKIRIQVNAENVFNQTNFIGTLNNSNKDFQIGAYQPGLGLGVLSGVMGYVAVWQRPLGSGERRALYNDGLGLQIPFTTVTASGQHSLGGYTISKTPTEATPSGKIGGYVFAARQFGPSQAPGGINPKIGGYVFAPRSWPVPNPNTPGSSSGLASLTNTEFLSSYWTLNEASGRLRTDLVGNKDLIPYPYKYEFKGDKAELNVGLSGFWPMDDWSLYRRQDVIGANHLTPNDNDSDKVVTVAGSLSGAKVSRLTNAYYSRSAPTDQLITGSGDLTVAFWTKIDTLEPTVLQGFVNKWESATNDREWTIHRTASTNPWTPARGLPTIAVTDDPTLFRLRIAASGNDTGFDEGDAPKMEAGVPYFIATRFNVASGIINITYASGSAAGGTWGSRIFNQSDPEPQLQSGLADSDAGFFVGTLFGGEEIIGSIANVGLWRKYLTDDELELLWGSGVGQQIKPKSIGTSNLPDLNSVDPIGPGLDTTITKFNGSAKFDEGGGAGGGATDSSMFKIEHGQGGEYFDFDGSESFTFAGWVRFDDTNTQIILSKSSDEDGERSYQLRRNNNDGRIDWMMGNSAGTSFTALEISTTFTSADTWYFVSCGWDKDNSVMWGRLNNGSIAETAKTSDFSQSKAPFVFGQGNSSSTTLSPLNGRLDAWGLWKGKRLSAAELNTLYNSGTGRELTTALLNSQFDPFFLGYDEPGNKIGGYLFSKAPNNQRKNVFFGGYTKAPGFTKGDTFFGGFLLAQPLQSAPTANIGGLASGLHQFGPNEEESGTPQFGGWTFGQPSSESFIEQHSRTLVKVRSQDVVDQALNLDAQIILLQQSNKNFNAKLTAYDVGSADFNARLNVEAVKLLPSSTMSISSATDSNDVTQVTVTASGTNFEEDTFFVNAQIDFGEPYGFGGSFGNGGFANPTPNISISGFNLNQIASGNNVVSGVHDFNYPGKYIIVASFTDNLGQITSSAFSLNTITSGSIASVTGVPVEGVDYPAIQISGTPRQGLVPPSLEVDFGLEASGIITGPVGASVRKLNKAVPVSASHLFWAFNNGITATMKQPISTYVNPGLYIPTVRYQFIHPSGTLVSASGGAPSGQGAVYSSKAIWISDSLIVGINR